MEFSGLLDKIGRGQRLSENELADLRDNARAIDEVKNAVKGWLPAGSSNPYFKDMGAAQGFFETMPMEFIRVERTSIAQSIPHSTLTDISWTGASQTSSIFNGTGTSGVRIEVSTDRARRIGLMGVVQWDVNATGYRSLQVRFYDSSDTLLYGLIFHRFLPNAITNDVHPIAATLQLIDQRDTAYMKFHAFQTSGGALDLTFFDMGIFLVY
jgi:hypothetical protein